MFLYFLNGLIKRYICEIKSNDFKFVQIRAIRVQNKLATLFLKGVYQKLLSKKSLRKSAESAC